jgi:membrane protein
MSLLKTTVKNFVRHQCTDLAAALTYYAVFAIMPALLALVSLLSVVGDANSVRKTARDILNPLLSDQRVHDIDTLLRHVLDVSGAPLTLAAGAAVALWSASGYVGAFGRAMNRIREVEETRPFWKLRPLMLLITLVAVIFNAAGLVIIVVSGPIARSIGDKLGVGRDAVDIWDIAKWPVLAITVVLVVALLYHATPNVRTGRIRLLSLGAFVALLVWAGASTGFAFYVANFSSYNKTYGSIAGVIVALLWLWITNVALLFGAELDAARDARRAATAMTAAHGELHEVALTSSGRRRPPSEQFPLIPGEPVYGPLTQPVPDEE